jgi:ankyrin repeat protein
MKNSIVILCTLITVFTSCAPERKPYAFETSPPEMYKELRNKIWDWGGVKRIMTQGQFTTPYSKDSISNAWAAYAGGEFEKAEELYYKTAMAKPGHPELYFYLALCNARLNEEQLSLDYLAIVMEMNEDDFWTRIVEEPDLASLRKSAGFAELEAKHNLKITATDLVGAWVTGSVAGEGERHYFFYYIFYPDGAFSSGTLYGETSETLGISTLVRQLEHLSDPTKPLVGWGPEYGLARATYRVGEDKRSFIVDTVVEINFEGEKSTQSHSENYEVVSFVKDKNDLKVSKSEKEMELTRLQPPLAPKLAEVNRRAADLNIDAAIERVKKELAEGADINALKTDSRESLLIWAARAGHARLVEFLIDKKIEIDRPYGNFKETALHEAAEYGAADVVTVLVEHHATIDTRDELHRTPLGYAIMCHHTDIAKYLIRRGADPGEGAYIQSTGPSSALIAGLSAGDPELLEMIVDKGVDVNYQRTDIYNRAGDTALIGAARAGDRAAVELLLRHGARCDIADYQGHTASFYAEQSGHPDIVEILKKEKR